MDPNKSKGVAGLRVGLIGLGLMGTPMAHKLSQSGVLTRIIFLDASNETLIERY